MELREGLVPSLFFFERLFRTALRAGYITVLRTHFRYFLPYRFARRTENLTLGYRELDTV
jgi:hypothetical protein